MKRILFSLILLVLPIADFGQTVDELFNKLINKQNNTTNQTHYKSVLNETITINSTSNEFWSGGNSKYTTYIKLPSGTIKWYYRVTLMEVGQSYFYNSNESLYSLLSNDHPLFVNNQTTFGINFYIINDYAKNDFIADRNFSRYLDYQNENTRGFNGVCNLTYNNLMICIKNPNLKDGLKAIVEVVAYGNYTD